MTNKQQWLQAGWVTGVIWLFVAVLLEVFRPGLIVQYGAPVVMFGVLFISILILSPMSLSIHRAMRWLVPIGAGAILLSVGGVTVWTVLLSLILLGVLYNL